MILCQVIGTVVAPVAISILEGRTLLLVCPVTPDGRPAGRTRIAIDRAGAGIGERVLVLEEGNGARQILGDPKGAVKTVVVGVVDYVETEAGRVYDAASPSPR